MPPQQTVNALRRELQAQGKALASSSATAEELRKGVESLNKTRTELAVIQKGLAQLKPSEDVLKVVQSFRDGTARESAIRELQSPDLVLVQLVYGFLGIAIDEPGERSIADSRPLEREGHKFVGAAIVQKLAFIIERMDRRATLNPLFIAYVYSLFAQLVNAFLRVVKGALLVTAMRLFLVARARVKALSLEPPPPKLIFLQNSVLPNSPNAGA